MRDSARPLDDLRSALNRAGRSDVAAQLIDAELGGATGTEILGRLGAVLRTHARLRATLDDDGRRAWDAMVDAIERAWPASWLRLRLWLARWLPSRSH